MISAASFIEAAKTRGFGLYTGVPCSYLKPFINYVIDSPDLTYVGAANEGDAVAIASGADIGGKKSVVMFQNSGFGNAVNPLTSLNAIFRVPVLVITTLRGDPNGAKDEPQHKLMGEITTGMFDLLGIRWEWFPQDEKDVAAVLDRAVSHMAETKMPFGLVMKKDSVAAHKLQRKPEKRPISVSSAAPDVTLAALTSSDLPSRADFLRAVQKVSESQNGRDVLVATTGYTGRELYASGDRECQFYMVGSMGCASSFGLGLAFARPDKRVVVLDGDGAALMRLSAFATLGYERPKNLVHVLLDNEMHESTGGQSTVSHSIDFAGVAHACGYPRVLRAATANELEKALQNDTGESAQLTFIHCKMKKGSPEDLPRPSVTPEQVAQRLRRFLA